MESERVLKVGGEWRTSANSVWFVTAQDGVVSTYPQHRLLTVWKESRECVSAQFMSTGPNGVFAALRRLGEELHSPGRLETDRTVRLGPLVSVACTFSCPATVAWRTAALSQRKVQAELSALGACLAKRSFGTSEEVATAFEEWRRAYNASYPRVPASERRVESIGLRWQAPGRFATGGDWSSYGRNSVTAKGDLSHAEPTVEALMQAARIPGYLQLHRRHKSSAQHGRGKFCMESSQVEPPKTIRGARVIKELAPGNGINGSDEDVLRRWRRTVVLPTLCLSEPLLAYRTTLFTKDDSWIHLSEADRRLNCCSQISSIGARKLTRTEVAKMINAVCIEYPVDLCRIERSGEVVERHDASLQLQHEFQENENGSRTIT
jgi:hypothetical protein